MANASLAGRPFRLNPESVQWSYSVKVNATQTVGGKVVQVYGVDLGDITVSGSFGTGGWEEQLAFLNQVKQWGENQVSKATPVHFLFPSHKWDMWVYIKDFSNPGGQGSIEWANEIINPEWSLTLFPVEDNSGLRRVAQDTYIARLAEGLGWRQTEFNGPLDWTAVEKLISDSGASDLQGYLTQAVGG